MASNHNVQIRITAQNAADPAFKSLISDLNEVGSASQKAGQQASAAGTMFGGFGRTVAGVAGGIGAASLAMGALSKGFGFVTDSVFGVNNSLEQTKARLVAFTKDGAEAERILRDIREEASRTPFAFEEMASATASLLPLAQQSNIALMDLVETAEILAASNPMEGLAGAAFALREALSGDFTSIIERFNLPRHYINQLKEEGVPNIEIVRQSMQALGYDASLVGNLAETTAGQWSTLRDELSMLIADLGKPVFQGLGAAIRGINESKDDIAGVVDDIGEVAQALGTIAGMSPIGIIIELTKGGGQDAWDWVMGFGKETFDQLPIIRQMAEAGSAVVSASKAFNDFEAERAANLAELRDLNEQNTNAFQDYVNAHLEGTGYIVTDQNALNEAAEAYYFQQQQIADQAEYLAEREQEQANAAAAAADRRTAGIQAEGASLDDIAAKRDYAIDSLRRQNMETLDYVSTLSAQEQAAYAASEAMSRLGSASDSLSGIQGNLNDVMGVFASQGSEYASTQRSLEDGYNVIQDKQARGLELTEAEQQYLDRYPELYGRLAGAQQDAALQEGLVAAAKTEVMLAQDELNAAIQRGEQNLGPYEERLRNANSLLSDVDPQSGAQVAIENLTDAINTNLVTAINDLITKMNELDGMTAEPDVKLNHDEFIQKKEDVLADLGTVDESSSEPDVYLNTGGFDDGTGHVYQTLEDIDGRSATVTVEARFITTGDPLAMQVYGSQTSTGYVGITATGRAQGGYVDGPELALIGEDGPELVLPLSKPARMRQLLAQAGIVPMAEGGIVAANTFGGSSIRTFGTPDWGFLFTGIDMESERAAEQVYRAFDASFGDLGDLISGTLTNDLEIAVRDMEAMLQLAIASSAPQAVIDGLTAGLAEKRSELDAAMVLYATAMQQGLVDAWTSDMVDAVAERIGGVLDGSLREQLQADLDDMNAKIAFAQAAGYSAELIAAFQSQADDLAAKLADIIGMESIAAEAGLLDTGVVATWTQTLNDLEGIIDGSVQGALGQKLEDLRQQLVFALAGGAPDEIITSLQNNIMAVSEELIRAEQAFQTASDAGLVSSPFQIPLNQITALLPQMRDGGAGLIDELVAGIAEGATDLSGVMGVLDGIILAGTDKFEETIGLTGAEMMDTLEALEEQLTVNLAQALITGAEDTAEAIQTQIDAVVALMEHVEATADTTVESLLKINAVSGQIIKPPSGAGFVPRSGGGGGSISPAPSLTGGGAGSVFAALGPAYYGTTFNLVMPNANLVASWYSGALASDVALEPVTIG